MNTINEIPKASGFDNTICLLRTGYPFISNTMKELQTDIFQTHLMFKKVICITGKDAAQLFYDPDYFIRQGANPMRIQKTLFGKKAIQSMDGDAHTHRRELFLSLLSSDHIYDLNDIFKYHLNKSLSRWENKREITLFHEIATLLCKSACEWCGIPVTMQESSKRAHQFITMIYAIGAIGPMYWKGKNARKSTEKWIESYVKSARKGPNIVDKNTALYQITHYRDFDGKCLSDHAAAIELINVIRPTVAVSIYIVFSALALHNNPQYCERLNQSEPQFMNMFIEEVRRFYPVGPFLGARVKKDFTWKNYRFKKGTLVFLDVYGINNSPFLWKYPNIFHPHNFLQYNDHDWYQLISQGGGDPHTSHRCPGELLTKELMKTCIDFLVNDIDYIVPKQDLHFTLQRIPTLPASGFIIKDIKRKPMQ